MKIGLLECDHVKEPLRHIAGDYRDMFEALFKRQSVQVELEYFDVEKGELPSSVNACDGYLTTGSRYSAYDNEVWIDELKEFVRRLADVDKPFVGICFGHQLLAEALGGKVTRAESGWGIGAHNMKITQAADWMDPVQDECRIAYSHRDQVERMPAGSLVLAETAHCPIAMFRVGERMLGIQGHPEFPMSYAEALARGRRELIGADKVDVADFRTDLDDDLLATWMVRFFKQ